MKKALIVGALIMCAIVAVFVLVKFSVRTEIRVVTVHQTNEVTVRVASRTVSNEPVPAAILVPEEAPSEDDGVIKVRLSNRFARTLAPKPQQPNQ